MAGILQLIPLIFLAIFLGGFGWIGYQMYLYTHQLSNRAQKHMLKHNISYSKESGMKVGVKEMSSEEYSGKTQSVFVKAWNESQWPDYKSRFWNKEAQKGSTSSSRPSESRTASSSSNLRPASSRQSSAASK